MTIDPNSRTPAVVAPIQATFEDIYALVAADQGLTRRQHHDVASALNTFAEALGKSLAELPAHPGWLRERIKGFSPAMAGLKPNRWRNVLSLTRFALKRTGLARIPGRYVEPLTPPWSDLFDGQADRKTKVGLSRFARYCGQEGLLPQNVSEEVSQKFLRQLEVGALVGSPRKIHRAACVAWNRAAASSLEWPQCVLNIPDYRQTYAVPWTSFPASLKADVDKWLAHLSGDDIFEKGSRHRLKPGSVRTRALQLHEFVSALVRRGIDPQSLLCLADVVVPETVAEGLRFFVERTSEKRAHEMASALLAVARHFVKCDEEHLERLKEMRGCLEAGPRQMTAKNRARLRQFDDPENVRALYSLPDLLVAEAARAKTPTRSDALVVQTALAISIFLMIPIRIETLINIDFERHLVWTLKKGTVYLSIPEHEVKNRIAIEAALPARCVQILDLYLTKYRPLLLIGPSTSLFPGRTVGPKEQQTMRTQITKTVKSRCGMDVNPHLFRHIAGKVWLDAHPGSFGVVTLLLGHKSVNTTTKFYCGMETAAALRQFDDHVLGLGVGGSNAPNICKRAKA